MAGGGYAHLIYSKVRPLKQKNEDCRAERKSNAGKMFCEYSKTVFFLNKKCNCFKKLSVCYVWAWMILNSSKGAIDKT